jgi:hypothetical protein
LKEAGAALNPDELVLEVKLDCDPYFLMRDMLVTVDGVVQFDALGPEHIEEGLIPVFRGTSPAGEHTMRVRYKMVGYGRGSLSDLRGYKFEVKSSHVFESKGGEGLCVTAHAFFRSGPSTPLEQRPAMRFTQEVIQGDETPSATP